MTSVPQANRRLLVPPLVCLVIMVLLLLQKECRLATTAAQVTTPIMRQIPAPLACPRHIHRAVNPFAILVPAGSILTKKERQLASTVVPAVLENLSQLLVLLVLIRFAINAHRAKPRLGVLSHVPIALIPGNIQQEKVILSAPSHLLVLLLMNRDRDFLNAMLEGIHRMAKNATIVMVLVSSLLKVPPSA